ncbi:hypothetical protein ADK75_37915 [Streptomyces virginiae]|uniref:Major facilitator superfamily (MFS) profile domain-containing protein n=2 Tax=Streptomyces virginiae TaxID=1961 RepID=A0A0L8M0I4_STRVG|nr:hypothetical protein ADK75_37915 [Streptomyces virginiae]
MTLRTSLWRHADFRNLWLSHSVSLVGTQVSVIALPFVALTMLDATASEVIFLSAVEFLPSLLLGLPAGVWVERVPLRSVLIASELARGIAMVSIPVTYFLGGLNLPLLFVVAFVIGLGTLFSDVAQLSYLPVLLDEEALADGNAKLEGSRSVAQLAGPALGGFLVQSLTPVVAIAADVVSYAVSGFFQLRVKNPGNELRPQEQNGLLKEIAEGMRFVMGNPLVRPLALAALAADLAFAAVLALQVPYAADVLHLTPGLIGVALAVGSAGGLLGAAISSWAVARLGPGRTLVVSIVVFSLGAVVVPLAGGGVAFAAGLFVVYLGVVVFNVLQTTVCQTVTPDRLLGRMNATLRFLSWGSVPVGAGLAGLLVAPLGLRGVLWVAAAVCACSVLPPLFSKIRGLADWPEAPDAADITVLKGNEA